jgi:hypothetical protein
MAIYYLKEEEGSEIPTTSPALSRGKRLHPVLIAFFCIILVLVSFLQLLPVTNPLEEHLLHKLPSSFLPRFTAEPSVRLLELPCTNGTLDSLDVAMALRGMGKLHPTRIMISGKVSGDHESEQLLQGVLGTTRAEGIDVIHAQGDYHSVPLCLYDPPSFICSPCTLETLPGMISNKDRGCFLPVARSDQAGIQLFAQTNRGEAAGSIWWELLQELMHPNGGVISAENAPVWLLGGRLLVFPDRATVFLTKHGMMPITNSSEIPPKAMTQEDFLLGIEQKERGEKSPDFETFWNDALVIIGKESDLPSLATLHHVASLLKWRHLSWISQLLLGIGCILLFLIGVRSGKPATFHLAALLIVSTLIVTILFLRHGIIIQWLSPAITSLSLVIAGLLEKRESFPELS